ncbi:hypothetical protein [uncultured Acetatifactor sp.]|jgi:hypothetical protein|nr:hypothetical protein [uncultured Acetatifactor sp.]
MGKAGAFGIPAGGGAKRGPGKRAGPGILPEETHFRQRIYRI